MKITLRNAERKGWTSGYGVINRELSAICDSENDKSADIHLFVSPPNSFLDVDPTKFNVGVTMGERGDLSTYAFPFVELSNLMDLIVTTSPWQKAVMELCGIMVPIEVVPLGIDFKAWYCPVHARKNLNGLVLDRGRDHTGGHIEMQKHLPSVHYMNCRTPRPTSENNIEVIKKGRYRQKDVFAAYKECDVFLKWGREGWGFPILEAMSAGCLIITNCVHLGYLEDGKNALFFRSVPELIQHLRRASVTQFTEIKRAGQETAKQLTWDKARKRLLEVIHQHARTK